MEPGLRFKESVEGVEITVWLRKHFVERFDVDSPDRPAAKRTVKEEWVDQKIREALAMIAEIAAGDPDAGGVIVSRTLRFSMVFSLVATAKGIQLNMITISPRADYQARSVKDYVIKINPSVDVHFADQISPAQKHAALVALSMRFADMEAGILYHEVVSEELIEYWAERRDNSVYVDSVSWTRDVYEVQVR